MDFSNSQTTSQQPIERPSAGSRFGAKFVDMQPGWMRLTFVVMLFSIAALTLGVAGLLYYGGPKESRFVQTNNWQAVYLANGQTYVGKIKTVNNKFVNLQNVFYVSLASQQSNQSRSTLSSSSLVKLGCEVYGSSDQMVINSQQVSFWENLKSDGQVSKAIAQWQKDHPNGEQCTTASATSSTSSSTSTKSTTSTTTPSSSSSASTTNNSSNTSASNSATANNKQ